MTAFGSTKTVTCSTAPGSIVNIEVSNDVGATKWAPLWTYSQAPSLVIQQVG